MDKDQEIIKKMTAKQFAGLNLLIDCYGDMIFYIIRTILNHPAEKEHIQDVQNEIFFKIWQNITHFDSSKSSLKTWVSTLSRNHAIDCKRKVIKNLHGDILPNSISFEENYLEKERFLSLIETLNEEDQLIFLRLFFYKYTPQEIGLDLGLNTEIIYNRISRGKKKLKQILLKEEL